MSLPPIFPSKTTAGIVTTTSGDRVVAGSRRADGSLRKELKIRPGYTPEEDIKRYRSARMAEADARAAVKGIVPGAMVAPVTKQVPTAMSKAQKKNAKRKEKRKEEGGGESEEEGAGRGKSKEKEEEVPESWDDGDEEAVAAPPPAPEPEPEPVVVAVPVDDEKRVKALRKKLRQAEQLRSRESAEFTEAEKVKVEGIAGLEEEIARLSLSSGGGEKVEEA